MDPSRCERLLSEVGRIARLGWWEWRVGADAIGCSEMIRDLFGFAPHDTEVRYAAFVDRVYPDDRELLHDAMNSAVRRSSSAQLSD